jgi:hypothetical protein
MHGRTNVKQWQLLALYLYLGATLVYVQKKTHMYSANWSGSVGKKFNFKDQV